MKAFPLALKKLREQRIRQDQSEGMFPADSLGLWLGGRLGCEAGGARGDWDTNISSSQSPHGIYQLSRLPYCLDAITPLPPARAAGEHRSLSPPANFPRRSPLITLKSCRRKSHSGCCGDMWNEMMIRIFITRLGLRVFDCVTRKLWEWLIVNTLASVGGLFVVLLRSPFKDDLFKQPYVSSSECADASLLYAQFPNKKKKRVLPSVLHHAWLQH